MPANNATPRPEYRSETGKLTRVPHAGPNVFRYGHATVKKYLNGHCTAQIGNAMHWEADSEAALIARLDAAGYGND